MIPIGSVLAVIGPLFALSAHFFRVLAGAYAVVFVALGVVYRVRLLGFRNDLMGIAREGSRRAYIGTANTVLGMLTLVPMLGGLVAESHVIRHALWGDGCARGIRLCDVVDSGCGVISSKG